MSTRVVDRVDEWDERSFTGGYRELQRLADDEFSGVVRAGGGELYMTKGVVVGIRQGSIEDFEDTQGSVYVAPSDALPLLGIMQERNDEVRDKFYTEKTPISDVDKTLSDGGFTGYVELSENVLSGDYYLVYHGGRSMSVGFVGESARLIDQDEAFETADDEVGIYKVRPAGVDRIEIPATEEPASASDEASTGSAQETAPDPGTQAVDQADTPDQTDGTRDDQQSTPADRQPQEAPGRGTEAQQESASESVEDDTAHAEPREADRTASDARHNEQATANTVEEQRDRTDQSDQPRETEHHRGTDSAQSGSRGQEQPAPSRGQSPDPTGENRQRPSRSDPAETAPTEPTPEWEAEPEVDTQSPTGGAGGQVTLEQRAVPSLDPAQTREPRRSGGSETEPTQPESRPQPTPEPSGRTEQHSGGRSEQRTQQPPAQPQDPSTETVDTGQIDELEAELEEKEAEIQRLETDLETAESESARLREQLDSAREARDELESEVERLEAETQELEAEIQRLESELGASTSAERRITEGEALAGTDIFIRYHSKGDATLEKAHGSGVRKDEVHDNLRLEKHTQFDAGSVAVGSQSYDEYLEQTVEYQFVEWLVRELLFEIRETGHEKKLKDLYDVLPAVDRAELSGVVEAVYTSDGQETRTEESFDIILRNRMGTPLLVANLNNSREAATESMMETLITSAERVGQSSGEFAGAFLVTQSFFDPGALETAEESTQGGLFSRDKRKSFVNLSRKQGYHLCLVEARNENFHLTVPEL